MLNFTNERELQPCGINQKSFYHKAHLLNDRFGGVWLKSYDTVVCGIDHNNNFRRTWDGYSVTTMKHINAFLNYVYANARDLTTKAQWEEMSVYNYYDYI